MPRIQNRTMYKKLIGLAKQNDISVYETDLSKLKAWGYFSRNTSGLNPAKTIVIDEKDIGLLQKCYCLAHLISCSIFPVGMGLIAIKEATEVIFFRNRFGVCREASDIATYILYGPNVPDIRNVKIDMTKMDLIKGVHDFIADIRHGNWLPNTKEVI